jgi:hypothetical protein
LGGSLLQLIQSPSKQKFLWCIHSSSPCRPSSKTIRKTASALSVSHATPGTYRLTAAYSLPNLTPSMARSIRLISHKSL